VTARKRRKIKKSKLGHRLKSRKKDEKLSLPKS
jgi:hypothetical protein